MEPKKVFFERPLVLTFFNSNPCGQYTKKENRSTGQSTDKKKIENYLNRLSNIFRSLTYFYLVRTGVCSEHVLSLAIYLKFLHSV